MNWFQQNRFLGTSLIVFGVATLAALYFLFSARSGFAEARARFDENAAELNRLRRLTPLPNEVNLRKMKTQAEDYAAELEKLKAQLKTRVLPATPIAPNEFQARVRQVITSVAEKARANRVKLPDNFFAGFDEYAAALPDTAAAPALGQQLAQVEVLLNILLDARVDSITSMRRVAPAAAAAATPSPAPGRRLPNAALSAPASVERTVIDATFVSSPGAARRVLNQISTASQQFYVIRTLHVLNEKDKGPARDGTGGAASAVPPPATSGTPPPASALNFIVGNERVQTSARIEMVRFPF